MNSNVWKYLWKWRGKMYPSWLKIHSLPPFAFPWFVIHIILIPLKLHRGMNGIPFSMICILVHNCDNWSSLWMRQITNSSNGEWSNIRIINSFNVGMHVLRRIDDSNILASYPYISTLVDQCLSMCAVVGGHVEKWIVTLTLQPSINSDLLYPLCRM